MRSRKADRIVVALALMTGSYSLPAQELLTAGQAVELALKQNYAIRIAQNDEQSAENNVTWGNAGFLPSVDINAVGTLQSTDIHQEFSSGLVVDRKGVGADALNGGLGLSWILFDGRRMFITWNRLKEEHTVAGHSLRQQMENTVAEVLNAYYDVVRLKQQLNAQEFGLEVAEEQVLIATTRLQVGSGSLQQQLQARIDRNTWRSQILRQKTLIENAKTTLNRLLSRDVLTAFEVEDTIPEDYDPSLPELTKTALDQNASLMLAKSNRQLSGYTLSELQSFRYPRLAFTGGYNFTRTSSEGGFALFNRSIGPAAGLTLSWNLYNGGILNTQIRNARLGVQNADFRIKETEYMVSASVLLAYRELQNARELKSLEEENFDAAKENLVLAKERFRVGNTDIVVVKEAQRSYEEAVSRLTDVRYAAKQAETELMRLNGQLIR